MAEKASREASSRRQSFRRSLADAGLPDDALERLEAKRRQLDDSIHKYIAAKEREYKSFEKDEIQRQKLGENRLRRPSSDSTPHPAASPPKSRTTQQQHRGVVNALLSAGVRREHIGQPHSIAVVDEEDGAMPTLEARPSLAGLTDRRASVERDKEFIGVFTPTFLPALEEDRGASSHSPARADSAPPAVSSTRRTNGAGRSEEQHSQTDANGQAKQKRPIQLQLASRTSSSGSSADGTNGRLASALKSPTHPRPKRKRVSLAVGDTIVAPSDNVPLTTGSSNSTPSHSRTRSPGSDRDASSKVKSIGPPNDSPQQSASAANGSFAPLDEVAMSAQLPHRGRNDKGKQAMSKEETNISNNSSDSAPRPSIDGDLEFALDEEDMIADGSSSSPNAHDRASEIMGRIKRLDDQDGNFLEDEHGDSSRNGTDAEEEEEEDLDVHAQHIEFHPGSVQQTNSPGFRRPSVTVDPVYRGADYDRAEHNAVTYEIYGSSFNRPASKSSFTAGSLGESYMAMNAARMIKERRGSEQGSVRS